jgi:hypothetical protein
MGRSFQVSLATLATVSWNCYKYDLIRAARIDPPILLDPIGTGQMRCHTSKRAEFAGQSGAPPGIMMVPRWFAYLHVPLALAPPGTQY